VQPSPLQGRTILIVEDEPLIAIDIEQELATTGAEITITSVLEHALLLVEHDGLSAAVLDHAIGASDCSPLYDRLNERGIPFIIFTAFDLPEKDRRGGTLVAKPALPGTIVAALEVLLSPG
jgi:DNA-binding response OmpR family regulator